DDLLGVDGGVPREVGLTVPLRGLRLLVELVQRGALTLLVVPREDGVGVVLHRVDDGVDVFVRDGEDRLEVVGVGAPEDLFVGGTHCWDSPLWAVEIGATAPTRRVMSCSHGPGCGSEMEMAS